ncbi:MAG: S-layer homology domain-containing protein [Anaerotignaceae bacterium]
MKKNFISKLLILSIFATNCVGVGTVFANPTENISVTQTAEEATEDSEVDFAKYDLGVTVEEDSNSPTGYTATFIYAEQNTYTGLSGNVKKVEIYSDCFNLFEPAGGTIGEINAKDAVSPENYTAGLAPAGGNSDTAYYGELTEFSDGLWAIQIPLSSGAFVYNFRITDENDASVARLDDPSNPTVVNSGTGIKSLSSMVYVPYKASTMGTSTFADRSVELPISDSKKAGTVDTVAYTGVKEEGRGLAVYLPAGYDANREEPYKVLYLSHGTSGDVYGNELRWMNEGAVKNMMDNLIAEGKTEPFVVVTMNNQEFSLGENNQGPNWDSSVVQENQIKHIMPFVEEKYNVYDTAEGRAYAGLSMGGSIASDMLMYQADAFSYYGIWSYSDLEGMKDAEVQNRLKALETAPNVMLATGKWDFGYNQVVDFGKELDSIGIDSYYLEVPAAHDWECWQLTFADAVENFLWKTTATPVTEETPAETPAETPEKTTVEFTDVTADDWFNKYVMNVVEKGWFAGTSETTFSPQVSMTRAMLTTALWRMENQPESTGTNAFTDVQANSWYANAVAWAQENSIVNGYSEDTFGTNDNVTREQVATILFNYATKIKGMENTEANGNLEAFADGKNVSTYAENAMNWAVSNKIINGTGSGNLDPQGNATRAEVATMLTIFNEMMNK